VVSYFRFLSAGRHHDMGYTRRGRLCLSLIGLEKAAD
jgi:hypothetical protein